VREVARTTVIDVENVVRVSRNALVAIQAGWIEAVTDQLEDKYADSVERAGCLAPISVQSVDEMPRSSSNKKLDSE
jgi:hypothetical protein